MSKRVYLTPLAVGFYNSTNWVIQNSTETDKSTIVDPGDPPDPDITTASDNLKIGPNLTNTISFTLTGKPSDVQSVESFAVWINIRHTNTNDPDAQFNLYALDSSTFGSGKTIQGLDNGPAGNLGAALRGPIILNAPTGIAWVSTDISSTGLAIGMAPAAGNTLGTFEVYDFWAELTYEPTRDIGAVRDIVSRRKWQLRDPLDDLEVVAPLHIGCDLDILDSFPLSHPAVPHPEQNGLLSKPWQRGHYYPVKKTVDMENNQVTLRLRNRRPRMCLYQDMAWSTLWSADASAWADGIARFSIGSARTFSRASSAWIDDPSDSLVREITDDVEKNASGGLAIESSRTNVQKQSSFKNGTSGWTLNGTGINGSAIAVDADDVLFDISETPNSLKFTSGSPIHTTDLEAVGTASSSISANAIMRVSLDYKNNSTAAPLSWGLQRGADSAWWNDSGVSWGTTQVWNALTGASSKTRAFSEEINVGTSATTLTLRVGVPTGTGTAGQIDHLYHAQNEEGTFATTRILTESTSVARVADALVVTNDLGARVWNAEKGAFAFQVIPGWDAADVDAENKTCFYLQHSTDNYEWVYFDGTNSQWVAERKVQGVTYQVTKSATPVRGTVYDIVYRWTGGDGELDKEPYSLSLFVDGSSGTDTVANNYGIASVWEFEDNLLDSVGSNHLTVESGSAAYATGLYGRAFDTNASIVKLSTTDSAAHDVGSTDDLTVFFKINIQALTTGTQFLMRKGSGVAPNAGWAVVLTSGGVLSLRMSDGVDDDNQVATAIGTSSWYSYVGVMERGAGANGELRVYLNGALDATDSDISAIGSLSNSNDTNIFTTGVALDVLMDQVGIEKRAWTTEEISRYHNSSTTTPDGIKVKIDAAPTQADDVDLEYGAKNAAEFLDGQVRLIHSFQYVPFDEECKRFPPR